MESIDICMKMYDDDWFKMEHSTIDEHFGMDSLSVFEPYGDHEGADR